MAGAPSGVPSPSGRRSRRRRCTDMQALHSLELNPRILRSRRTASRVRRRTRARPGCGCSSSRALRSPQRAAMRRWRRRRLPSRRRGARTHPFRRRRRPRCRCRSGVCTPRLSATTAWAVRRCNRRRCRSRARFIPDCLVPAAGPTAFLQGGSAHRHDAGRSSGEVCLKWQPVFGVVVGVRVAVVARRRDRWWCVRTLVGVLVKSPRIGDDLLHGTDPSDRPARTGSPSLTSNRGVRDGARLDARG